MKDFAVVAKLILTFSITDGFCSSVFGSVVLLGAGSPANLSSVNDGQCIPLQHYLLVGHDNEKPFTGVLVGLELIVFGVYASTAA